MNSEVSQELPKQEGAEFEPTKMIVVQDFSPCVEDELAVKRGQTVKALYQENEWRFVVADDGSEGFIPYTYCVPIAESTVKPKKHEHFLPKSHQNENYNFIGEFSRPSSTSLLHSYGNIGVILFHL